MRFCYDEMIWDAAMMRWYGMLLWWDDMGCCYDEAIWDAAMMRWYDMLIWWDDMIWDADMMRWYDMLLWWDSEIWDTAMMKYLDDMMMRLGAGSSMHTLIECLVKLLRWDALFMSPKASFFFSLAFGMKTDFGMLKTLSIQNYGFARKIYTASDASLQLEGNLSEKFEVYEKYFFFISCLFFGK